MITQSKEEIKRRALTEHYWGLNRRVARQLGLTHEFVSRVRNGRISGTPDSERAYAALKKEMAKMDKERQRP